MTVRGVEAIKMYMPPTKAKINTNVQEEKPLDSEVIISGAASATSSMSSSVARYKQEWQQLLEDLDENPERMNELAFAGELKMSKFRSIYWALLLRVLNADHSSWREQRQMQRMLYNKLTEEFLKSPEKIDVPADDDPLSQSQQSVWNQFFSNQELFGVIKQDVVRTCPGVDFFRKDIIQDAMCNILFYYAREHPYMSYRQGMHEILAPILFVIYGDQQSFLHYSEIAKQNDNDELLADVLASQYLEADSYSIFSRLMSSIESYYRITSLQPTPGGYLANSADTAATAFELEIIAQLNFIRDKILAKEDSHLHHYLQDLDIPLHLFGIRWLRLLFGREFVLVDLMVFWDAIFADSDRFELPNYILVAMLIRIRDKLLMSDYTKCLTHLMRYPQNEDAQLILRHALHMQSPTKFELPSNAFVYFTPKANVQHSASSECNSLTSTTTRPKALSQEKDAGLRHKGSTQRAPSTLLKATANIAHQISVEQARNACDAAELSSEVNRIKDGYGANSPELLRLELRNAQSVITIARSKLQSYLATVRQAVTKVHSEELTDALDGIGELCNFLDVKFMFPLHARSRAPIDQATEANEQRAQTVAAVAVKSALQRSAPRETKTVLVQQPESDQSAHDWLTTMSSGLTTEFVKQQGSDALAPRGNCYEKPDVGYMFSSSHLLGHLKEIELLPIASDEKAAAVTDVVKSDATP